KGRWIYHFPSRPFKGTNSENISLTDFLYFLSKLYFPGPNNRMLVKDTKNIRAFSLTVKGSEACTMKKATSMVKIVGTVAQRVLNPIITKRGHTNSAIAARNKEGASPMPKGLPNAKLPSMICRSFGVPWVSIKTDEPTRKSKRPKSFISRRFLFKTKIG